MIDKIDNITLKGPANEFRKLGIKCNSGITQQNSGERNNIDRIPSETVSQNVSSS
ncbi:unnamed protein product [Hymenolepis diminuta]|uniref:Uncharacterized protein n=1 Tax=Hymenolepis diminuta TaxID=6216 RepID=A0A564Y613_HYMDI|nr:unnamed protein product [Hymenolepis diminuta]